MKVLLPVSGPKGCQTCRFGGVGTPPSGRANLECRIDPPRSGAFGISTFPRMLPDDFCGAYRRLIAAEQIGAHHVANGAESA